MDSEYDHHDDDTRDLAEPRFLDFDFSSDASEAVIREPLRAILHDPPSLHVYKCDSETCPYDTHVSLCDFEEWTLLPKIVAQLRKRTRDGQVTITPWSYERYDIALFHPRAIGIDEVQRVVLSHLRVLQTNYRLLASSHPVDESLSHRRARGHAWLKGLDPDSLIAVAESYRTPRVPETLAKNRIAFAHILSDALERWSLDLSSDEALHLKVYKGKKDIWMLNTGHPDAREAYRLLLEHLAQDDGIRALTQRIQQWEQSADTNQVRRRIAFLHEQLYLLAGPIDNNLECDVIFQKTDALEALAAMCSDVTDWDTIATMVFDVVKEFREKFGRAYMDMADANMGVELGAALFTGDVLPFANALGRMYGLGHREDNLPETPQADLYARLVAWLVLTDELHPVNGIGLLAAARQLPDTWRFCHDYDLTPMMSDPKLGVDVSQKLLEAFANGLGWNDKSV